MSEIYKILGQVSPPSASWANLYTVPASAQAVISTISICNTTSASSSFKISLQPNGESVDIKHYIAFNSAIPAYDTLFISIGATLGDTDQVSVYGYTASLAFNAFGTEIF